MHIDELQPIGKGTQHEVFLYENLVIKHPIKEDFSKDNKKHFNLYNKLLVKFSGKGIRQNLKFAPILDYVKDRNRFCTISPYIDGTELPDCSNEQLREIGVEGMKRYLGNNQKLSGIGLRPEFHDERNFILSEQGNINVVDFSTHWLLNKIWGDYPISPYWNKAHDMESTNQKSCSMILSRRERDDQVLSNLHVALEQTPNSKQAREIVGRGLSR